MEPNLLVIHMEWTVKCSFSYGQNTPDTVTRPWQGSAFFRFEIPVLFNKVSFYSLHIQIVGWLEYSESVLQQPSILKDMFLWHAPHLQVIGEQA